MNETQDAIKQNSVATCVEQIDFRHRVKNEPGLSGNGYLRRLGLKPGLWAWVEFKEAQMIPHRDINMKKSI